MPLHGKVELKAVAGDCIDTASFRSVAEPNPSYKLQRPSPRVQTGYKQGHSVVWRLLYMKRRRTNEYQETQSTFVVGAHCVLTAILTIAAIVGNIDRKSVRHHPERCSECIDL